MGPPVVSMRGDEVVREWFRCVARGVVPGRPDHRNRVRQALLFGDDLGACCPWWARYE